MGFAVWVDMNDEVVWAQGTHEYRPMGTAVVAVCDQFRPGDFRQALKRPRSLDHLFAGFFASLGTVNQFMRDHGKRQLRPTPAHLL